MTKTQKLLPKYSIDLTSHADKEFGDVLGYNKLKTELAKPRFKRELVTTMRWWGDRLDRGAYGGADSILSAALFVRAAIIENLSDAIWPYKKDHEFFSTTIHL